MKISFLGHVDTKPVPLARFIQASMIGPIVPLCILVFIVRKKVLDHNTYKMFAICSGNQQNKCKS